MRRFASWSCVAFATAALAAPSFAAKPAEFEALEIIDEAPAASVVRGNARIDLATGAAVRLSGLDLEVASAEPEAQAREALDHFRSALGLDRADLSDLVLHHVRTSAAGTVVRLRQAIDGVPVFQSEVVVALRGNVVRTISSSYTPGVVLPVTKGPLAIDAASAEAITRRHLGLAADAPSIDRVDVEPVLYVLDGRSHLAHRVRTIGQSAVDDWEALVDTATGDLLRVEDTKLYATGTGVAFTPDPLSSATVSYGTAGYTDGGDATTPDLQSQIFPVTLLDITETAGTWSLTGPWAEVIDHDSPSKGLFTQSSSDFTFDRTDDAFEAVNGYYHIDRYMRYLNLTLGLDITPIQYSSGVRFDPSGWGGADNSSYSSGTGRLSFGEGGVDDAEDADVLIHELGHALHDWVTAGGLSQSQGLSEGVGDYAASSYSRAYGQWDPSDAGYNFVFSWDGHNPFWNGRVNNWDDTREYPGDLTGSIHTDGQFWSSCNMNSWDVIGQDKSETAHWEGLARTTFNTNQEDAAQAVLDAAVDLGYSVADVQAIQDGYRSCGYDVTADISTTIFAHDFEDDSLASWSSTVP